MPHQTEPNVNVALGNLLQAMLPKSRVLSENTQTIAGSPGLKPDVLITAPGRSPVVIEAEYMPASNAEDEAKSRLGLVASETGQPIEASIALRYPTQLQDTDDLPASLGSAALSYCMFTEGKTGANRFPEAGWLGGSVEDLADMVRLVSVPERAVDQAANYMQQGIERVASILDNLDRTRPAVNRAIAEKLGMTNVPQTRRMACAIIANAMVFHQRLAGVHHGIKPLHQVCSRDVPNPQRETLTAWDDILRINYWPIFAIGRDILSQLTSDRAADILRTLEHTASDVNATGVDNAHDLTGRIFQRLIADRKYLATFYTLPASAALLARLAVAKMVGVDWSNLESIRKLRIADFACGTGALLSAVYEQVAARHERAGGDPDALHKVMMEKVLYGCDVMPSAVHITCATLSGIEPSEGFGSTRLYPLAYGRQKDGSAKIGSLEFLRTSAVRTLFNTSDPAWRTRSKGEETAAQIIAEVPDRSLDLVIMNPPFTSDTKHRDSQAGVLNAAFAAFNSTSDDQKEMAARLRRLAKKTCYHGHAGLASAFVALAHRKLRPNGVLAFVLPFTAINGPSWAKFREVLAKQYTDISIVSIAASGDDMSFSSDTGIAECLVVGRKLASRRKPTRRAVFISLKGKPSSFLDAQGLSNMVLSAAQPRRLEDGPYGGLPIYRGVTTAGEILDAPLDNHKAGWGAARILDASVVQVAHELDNGKLWLPGKLEAWKLPVAPLGQIGRRGLDSQLFVSAAHKGPFTLHPPEATSTYPALWNHDAPNETRLVCTPDTQLYVKQGMEEKAIELWSTASRAHINRDFRFTSQPLAAAFTEQRSIGGVAWPNVSFSDARADFAFVLWCNATLGLLMFWWHANRQQSGRGRKTIHSSESLPVLDFRDFTDEQLMTAEKIFDELRDKEFMPAYLADADPNRALLDRCVVCDLLGFDEETYEAVRRLSAKWCAEPSVHGGKPRPKDAKFVF